MSSVTSMNGYEFTNWGPLTTTFTPPPSCTTSPEQVYLAESGTPEFVKLYVDCKPSPLSCIPYGSKVPEVDKGPLSVGGFGYESPGLYCPSGWTTAGTASRAGDGPVTTSLSFDLVLGKYIQYNEAPYYPLFEAFMNVLQPSETVAMCCPSGMTPNPAAGCYSPITTPYPFSTGCRVFLPHGDEATYTTDLVYGETTVTRDFLDVEGTTPFSTMTISLQPSQTSSFVPVSVVPMVVFVHQPSDISKTDSESSAARQTGALFRETGGVLGVWIVAIVIGAALIGIA
ncbi:hypothetical protein BDV59DRAFT_200998 [Aspergillus ambiguus]|uniref:uncharacterized protein n=1 Tax=Aspergillus ambiguus TaxID=176160 RepID=UPI003CCCAC5C